MTYFGISNFNYLEDPFVNDLNLFPNIREEILLDNIKNNKNYDISTIDEEKVRLDSFISNTIPVLFEHRYNDMLKNIWDNINHGDIITNRASKRSLACNAKYVNIEQKWIDLNVDEHDKMIYLISKKSNNQNVPVETLLVGSQAPTVVFDNSSNHSYTVYRYMKRYNAELQCFEHYTCEIDGFVKSQINNDIIYTPIEFKSFGSYNGQPLNIYKLYKNSKISMAVQCKLSGVDNVILGFRDNSSMTLKYCSIPTIIKGVEYGVEKAFKRMEKNTARILQEYQQLEYPISDQLWRDSK